MVRPAPVFKCEYDGDVLFVTPLGHSLQFASGAVELQTKELLESLAEHDVAHAIVDLHKVNMLDSIVIGSLFAVASRISKAGGKTVLCNVSERMNETLNVVKLDTLVERAADRDEALKLLRG